MYFHPRQGGEMRSHDIAASTRAGHSAGEVDVATGHHALSPAVSGSPIGPLAADRVVRP
jgi:hypothetical protein